MSTNIRAALLLGLMALVTQCDGHGYMMVPPSRSSLWRVQTAPINYDDNALNCGGFYEQWTVYNGSCGPCGDPYGQPRPRDNEDGGKYGRSIIGQKFTAGQEVDITIQVTANHYGWFEFRLCSNSGMMNVAPQSCLNEHLLELADGSGTRYHIPATSLSYCTLVIRLKLPKGLACSRCVLQWHWNTATNWGVCDNGIGQMGCGPQETFIGCADIAILD